MRLGKWRCIWSGDVAIRRYRKRLGCLGLGVMGSWDTVKAGGGQEIQGSGRENHGGNLSTKDLTPFSLVSYKLGGHVSPANALVDVTFAALTAGIGDKLLLATRGGWNFNRWTSPQTFGPKALREYELAELGYAADL